VAFEFDPEKSAANLAKHGIDFEAAQALWLDDGRVTIGSVYVEEQRLIVIGRIYNRLWTAAITIRGEAVRIISVRRARRSEKALYDAQDD